MYKKENREGFSLLEIVIAILVVTIGLLALSAALVIGVTLPGRAKQQELAKQLANTIMESIIAAKESPRPGFNDFASISYTTAGGRFIAPPDNITPMLEPGPDGVYGTCDDGLPPGAVGPCGGLGTRVMELEIDPGRDGQYTAKADGTDARADNGRLRLFNFTREVSIRDLSADGSVKEVTVRVNFGTPAGGRDSVTLVCRLTNFRRF
ncbi:MAG: prepilin-type N-terminal cleavage/methylation domain-containing protein [Blastocatellia bacterium]|nr:prepilin-type N-terminal cleavage/methylation domain-containing protein [Blastocatellia bacterium]